MNLETLKSLIWLIAIPLLFFWMMRRGGGCGMMGFGRMHSDSSDDEGPPFRSRSGRPIDPVCGMEVDPAKAVATRTVDDATFFLCSTMCLETFDRDPERYAHQRRADVPRRHRHAGC